ncbi:uncharacterized protein LOC118463541 [Anopheles albimanus]|uniref:uncharacterized protein LOC118463541 n=1 Tax=Anopheles albimanus TaxID=7167 RepID=UPI001640E60B|nr:uncharacterized protein LOC118463541 [Anopheles albimanus]
MMTGSETLSAELISFYRSTNDAQPNNAESKKEADLRAQIEQKQNFLQSLKRLVSGMNNLYHGTLAGNEESVRATQIMKDSNTIAQRLIENYNSQQALAMQRRTNRLLSACDGVSELRAKQKMERMLEVVRVQEQVIAELRSSRRMMEVEKNKQTVLTLEKEIADIEREFDRARQEYRQEEDRICRTLADLGASIGEELLRRQEMKELQNDPRQQQQQKHQHQQLGNGASADEDFSEVIDAVVNTHESEDASSLQNGGDVSLMLLNESTSKYSFELEFKDPNDFPDILKIMQPANTSYEKLAKKCQQSVDTVQNRKKKHQTKKQSRIGGQHETVAEPAKKKQKQNVCKPLAAESPTGIQAGQNDQENQRPFPGEEIVSSHQTPVKRSNRLVKPLDSNVGQSYQLEQRTLRKRKPLEPVMEEPEAAQIVRKESKPADQQQQKVPPAVTTAGPDSMFKEPLPVPSRASGLKQKPKSQTAVQKAAVKGTTPAEDLIKQDRSMKASNVPEIQSKDDFLSPKRASSSQAAAKSTSNGAKLQADEVFLSPKNTPSNPTSSDSPPENLQGNYEHLPTEDTQNSDNSSIMMVESTSNNSMDFMLGSSSAEFDMNLSPEQPNIFGNDLDFLNDFSNERATATGGKGAAGTRKVNNPDEQGEPDGFDFAFEDGFSSERLDNQDLF